MLDEILGFTIGFFLYFIIAIVVFGIITRLMREYFVSYRDLHNASDIPPGFAWPILGGLFWPTFPLWFPFYILAHFLRFAFRAGIGEIDWSLAKRKVKGKYWTLRAKAAKE